MFLGRRRTRKFNLNSCFATDFQGWVLEQKLVAFLKVGQNSTPLFSDKLNTKTLKLFSS
jgi:hypothetical protein